MFIAFARARPVFRVFSSGKELKNREKFLLTAVGKSGEWWVHVAD